MSEGVKSFESSAMKIASQGEAQNENFKGSNMSSSSAMPVNQTPKPAPPRKSNLVKEVESLGIQSWDLGRASIPRGLNASELHMTRQKRRKLQGISEKTPVLDQTEPQDDIHGVKSDYPKRNKPAPKCEIIGGQSDPPTAAALRSILSEKRAEGLKKWEIWQERKERITNILRARHYSISSDLAEDHMVDIEDEGEDLDMTIQDGLHIFRPTADVLNDFEKFLLRIEDIVGRETGVVKVIIPEELLLPPDTSTEAVTCPAGPHTLKNPGRSIESSLMVEYLTKLDLRVSELQYLPIYDVRMMGGVRRLTFTCREDVLSHRRSVLELFEKDENYLGDIFGDVDFATRCEEEEMVDAGVHSSNDRYYSADIEATDEKRNALHCGKLNMKEFHSHGLSGAQTDKDRIHQPKLQIAGVFGSTFGLQMAGFGAYSLNILHSGAPKCWTVIKPADHQNIEFQLHPDVEQASLRGRRIKFVRLTSVESDAHPYAKNQKKLESLPCDFPPRCDLFLNHRPFYIPQGSLEACGVGFTKLVQYEGELIIHFPFAYYQGYSCGPSIAEQIGYTNERSELLNQEGLYQHCHTACDGPKPPLDFGAFPTAAASDAKRIEKTITAKPPQKYIDCRAKAAITSLEQKMKKIAQGDARNLRLKSSLSNAAHPMLDLKGPNLEDKEPDEEASGDKQGDHTPKKDTGRRRRLVRASDLPDYKR